MANQLKVGAIKPVLSSGYIGFYPSFQPATDLQLTDQSGKGNHAAFGADLTGSVAWSTALNYYSTTEDVTGTKAIGAQLVNGPGFSFAPATESLLIFGRVKIATPAGTRPLLGNSNASPNQGFGLKVTSGGKARVDIHRAGADVLLNVSTASIADGADHTVALGFDAVTQKVYLWIDGAIDAGYAGGTSIAAYTDWYPFTRNFVIGGAGHNGGKILSAAQSSRAWHLLKRTGGLPSTIDAIVERLHRSSLAGLTPTEWA